MGRTSITQQSQNDRSEKPLKGVTTISDYTGGISLAFKRVKLMAFSGLRQNGYSPKNLSTLWLHELIAQEESGSCGWHKGDKLGVVPGCGELTRHPDSAQRVRQEGTLTLRGCPYEK